MIIAFAGRKQSGKTSSCEFVKNLFETSNLGQSKIYNFADPLKQVCIDILGLTYDQCYGTDENKNELVDCYWPGIDEQMTAREVMQHLGTDMFRRLQQNVWSAATIRLIEKEKPDIALIADCRFPNEVDAVKKAGGIVIKLNRNLYESTHTSEIALDDNLYDQSNFDLVIDNQDSNLSKKNKTIYNFLIEKAVLS
tara:strand:- start:533 stop:1117 length:585 start_codon:yes stop_codon:yes gene_type:complete